MSSNREMLEHYVERYNAGHLDTVMTLFAEDAVQRMADGVFKSRRKIRERLARDLETCPDATYTVASFFADGDSFADEWTFTGTQEGHSPCRTAACFRRRQATGDPRHGARRGPRRQDHDRQPRLGHAQLGLIPQTVAA